MNTDDQGIMTIAAQTGATLSTFLEAKIADVCERTLAERLTDINKTIDVLQASLQSTVMSLDSIHAQLRTQPVASAPASSLDIDSSTLHRKSGSNEAGDIVPPVRPMASHYHVLGDQSQTHPEGSPTVSTQRRSRRRRARLAAASRHSTTQICDDQQVLQLLSGLKPLTQELGIFKTTPPSRGHSRPPTNRSKRRRQALMSRVFTDSRSSNATTRVVQNTDKLTVVARSDPERGTGYLYSV
ncbi:hypothetical protein EDB81DRAFT_768356 [Dactylonectria macrodidyma]|uniref:Uncharacterized protein n=1 Tax=Dactylonectria macrodidyma TaxID=307937 RepID=A0A9P9D494_9HYPO|nr:hypothetical protein EDB81DRAFT_768356 [Dactylonectria macrodidyma]